MRTAALTAFSLPFIFAVAACSSDSPVGPEAAIGVLSQPAMSRAPTFDLIVVPFSFSTDCPQGFELINEGEARIRQTIFYDAAGVPQRNVSQFILWGTVSNGTTGKSLRNDAQFSVFTNLVTGESSTIGAAFHLTSHGLIVQDAGRITYDGNGNVIFEAGTHEFANGESTDAMCEALS